MDYYQWIVIPLMIFVARITDVSLGTIRFIFISRGLKHMAAVIGFFEVLIWIIIIGQIMNNLQNPVCYVAYAGGFAVGTFVGISISEKMSLGMVMIRILTRKNADELVFVLREANHGVTSIEAEGSRGPVKVIFTIVQRRNAKNVIDAINKYNPKAFYTIEEIGYATQGIFKTAGRPHLGIPHISRPHRKGK